MDTFKINSRGQSRNIFYTSQICIIENKCRKDNNMYFSIQVSRKDQNLGLANEKNFFFFLLSTILLEKSNKIRIQQRLKELED